MLNPLRAKRVRRLERWRWSSYPATCGQAAKPDWLYVDFVLAQFAAQRARAIERYAAFVHEGARLPSVWSELQGQIYLGPKAFIEKMQALIDKKPSLTEIPRAQRRAAKRALAEFASAHERNEAIALAYLSGQHTMSAVAAHFARALAIFLIRAQPTASNIFKTVHPQSNSQALLESLADDGKAW